MYGSENNSDKSLPAEMESIDDGNARKSLEAQRKSEGIFAEHEFGERLKLGGKRFGKSSSRG
jgi:hypothetical protein